MDGAVMEAGVARRDAPAGGPAAPADDRPPRPRLTYNPAIDGLRAVAVAGVLAFHGGVRLVPGGFLGVSTFFTLSGFLITSLLLAERTATGTVGLRRFWSRRLRRLFPASALVLTLISLSALVTDEVWERHLRGDVLSALFQMANWHFLLDDRDYGDLFAAPSPVLHFWSLAIEEQFYWLFPLVVAVVAARARRPLRAVGATVTALIAVAVALTLARGASDPTFVYYATPVRMGEILAGALLAVAVQRGVLRSHRVARLAAVAGVVALAGSLFAWTWVGEGSPSVYRGGLLLYAALSATVVAATTVPGPVRSVLALEPLRLLGVVSYGVYLFHWPVFLLLDGDTGLSGPPLLVLRLAVTLALSVASYHLLEAPIRRGWRPRRAAVAMPALAAATVVVVAVVAVAVPVVSAPPDDPFAVSIADEPALTPGQIGDDTVVTMAVGDSTMFFTVLGLQRWGRTTGQLTARVGTGGFGCTIMRGGSLRYQGKSWETLPECDVWAEELPRTIEQARRELGRVDSAVVLYGPQDVADRLLPGQDAWHHVGEPEVDDYLRSEISAMLDLLTGEGLRVVWLTAPHIATDREHPGLLPGPFSESEPERIDRFNEIVRDVAAGYPTVRVVDLQAHLASLPGGELDATWGPDDEPMRPDGVHLTREASADLAERWLGARVVAAARDAAAGAGATGAASSAG